MESLIDQPTRKEFFKTLQATLFQKQTFIPPLQDQIKRVKKYAENYALHKEYPFLRTTNMAEHWFGRTKPEKVKKGFKTKKGLIKVLRALAVKITDINWKQRLSLTRDINDATNLLISGLLKKRPA